MKTLTAAKQLYILFLLTIHCSTSDGQTARELLELRQSTIDRIFAAKIVYECIEEEPGNTKSTEKVGFIKFKNNYKLTTTNNGKLAIWTIDPKQSKGIGYDLKKRPNIGMVEAVGFPVTSRFIWNALNFTHHSGDNKRLTTFAESISQQELNRATVTTLDHGLYRVGISQDNFMNQLDITFDKKLQYMITTISAVTPSIKRNYDVHYSNFKLINGFMIPHDIKWVYGWTTPGVTAKQIDTLKILSVTLNDKELEKEVVLTFPPKLTVHDGIEKISYLVGSQGEKLNVRKYEIAEVIPSQHDAKPHSPRPTTGPQEEKPSYQTFHWLLPTSLIVLLITIVLIIVKRRRD